MVVDVEAFSEPKVPKGGGGYPEFHPEEDDEVPNFEDFLFFEELYGV